MTKHSSAHTTQQRRYWVTGATGGLGRNVVTKLIAQGHHVFAIGRNITIGAQLTQQGAQFIQADLTTTTQAQWRSWLQADDVLIHCAALSSPWGRYADFYAINVAATHTLAWAALHAGVKRLVHISTPSIYFDFKHQRLIAEDSPLPKPVNHYAATKRMAEECLFATAQKGLSTVILRPRAIYGPHDEVLVPRILRAYKKGVMPLIAGGHAWVDLTYMDNIVSAIVLAANSHLPSREQSIPTYNISNGDPIQLKTVFDRLLNHIGPAPRYRNLPWPVIAPIAQGLQLLGRLSGREPVLTRYSAGVLAFDQTLCIDKARSELGYQPQVSTLEGIDRYLAWRDIQERIDQEI